MEKNGCKIEEDKCCGPMSLEECPPHDPMERFGLSDSRCIFCWGDTNFHCPQCMLLKSKTKSCTVVAVEMKTLFHLHCGKHWNRENPFEAQKEELKDPLA